ncbi:hypothetical protein ACFLYP_00625 [Chloroflexota bacterium]
MKKVLIVFTVLATAAIAFGAVGVASAQEAGLPAFRPGGPGGEGGPGGQGGPGGREDNPIRDLMTEAIAEALGLTADELQARFENGERLEDIAAEAGIEGEALAAMMEEAHQAALAAAVEQGLITEEEAQQFQQGGFGQGGPQGNGGIGGDQPLAEYMEAAIAEALGISAEELAARIEAGERLPDIAADLGIVEGDLGELMEGARLAALDQALADGAITQEQYDQFQEFDGQRRGGPGGSGGKGGPGGPGGQGGQTPPNSNNG